MTPRPLTLAEMLAAGNMTIPMAPAGSDPESMARSVDDMEAKLKAQIRTGERPGGRPRKIEPRRATSVRSLRLENSLWEVLQILADREKCSVNRCIEEALIARIGYLDAPNDLFVSTAESVYRRAAGYSLPPRRGEVISFDRVPGAA